MGFLVFVVAGYVSLAGEGRAITWTIIISCNYNYKLLYNMDKEDISKDERRGGELRREEWESRGLEKEQDGGVDVEDDQNW